MTVVVPAAAVAAAGMVAVVMVTMVIAHNIGIVVQLTGKQCRHSSIRTAGNTAVKTNARLGQRSLGTAADAAADQHIRVQCMEHTGQGTMASAVGTDHLRGDDLTVANIIDLKKLRVAKVLENITVGISDCNSHNLFSFRFYKLISEAPGAALVAAGAEPVVAALDDQGAAFHQHPGKLLPGIGIDHLYRGPGNSHLLAALLLG